MASPTADSNPGKENPSLNPYRRVRIVGRIRSFTEAESSTQDSKAWITVCKAEEGVSLSCSEQSASRKDGPYRLDYCYQQDEDNSTIFSREIEPLIYDVLNGGNASVIAYGAKGSGKTYTIQGSEDKPGLAVMSMTELLSRTEEAGKAVSVSILEVHQEHAYDLLDPKHSEVKFLGDGRGKINLKGLTQVSVKSISEFQNMYLNKLNISKLGQKIPLEQPKRSHKCLIMHVSKADENSNNKLEGKMLFVDLAGYEDFRRSSRDGVTLHEATKTNMSLQAVMNVVYALNANEIHVPYRESKLTRIFQESLGGINHVVVLTCLNPQFCQDTLHTLSLASRSCQSTNSTKSDKSSARFKLLSSQRKMPATTPNTSRKQSGSTMQVSTKKASYMSKGRALFDERKNVHSNKPQQGDDGSVKQLDSKQDDPVNLTPVSLIKTLQDKKSTFNHALTLSPDAVVVSQDEPFSETSLCSELKEDVVHGTDNSVALVPEEVVSQDRSTPKFPSDLELKENDESGNHIRNNVEANTQVLCVNSSLEDGKEKKYMPTFNGGSPPLSARLHELSKNFKSFCSSTPLSAKMPDNFSTQHVADLVEPKTPTTDQGTSRLEITKYTSPWDRLNARSSGMKDSLVQEYLKFFNTADKEELKGLKGIGEKRATYILELRQESPEPFKNLDDLENIGLSAKQVKGMMRKMAGNLFS